MAEVMSIDYIKDEAEYREKLNKAIIGKQKSIEALLRRLESAELDDKTMFLLMNVNSVFLTLWKVWEIRSNNEVKRTSEKPHKRKE